MFSGLTHPTGRYHETIRGDHAGGRSVPDEIPAISGCLILVQPEFNDLSDPQIKVLTRKILIDRYHSTLRAFAQCSA